MHIRENYTWFNLIIFNHLISISAFYPQNCCLNLHNFSLKFPGLPWSSKGSPKEPPKMASLCAASCNGVKPSTFSARCPAANRASTHWMEVEISWRVGVLVVVSKRLENYTELYPKKTHVRDCPFAILSFAFCLLTHDPAKGLIAFWFFPYIYSIIFPDQTQKIVIFRRSPRFIWIFTTLRFSPKLHPQVVSREIPNLLVNPPYLISSWYHIFLLDLQSSKWNLNVGSRARKKYPYPISWNTSW